VRRDAPRIALARHLRGKRLDPLPQRFEPGLKRGALGLGQRGGGAERLAFAVAPDRLAAAGRGRGDRQQAGRVLAETVPENGGDLFARRGDVPSGDAEAVEAFGAGADGGQRVVPGLDTRPGPRCSGRAVSLR
jgi:hypothetical protein